jgi:hypothetical protein
MNKKFLYGIMTIMAIAMAMPVMAGANLSGTGIDLSSLTGLSDNTNLDAYINNLITTSTGAGNGSVSSVPAVNDSCNDTLASNYDQQIQLISDGIDLAIDNTIANLSASACGSAGLDSWDFLDSLC